MQIREIDKSDDDLMARMYAVVTASQSVERPFFTPQPQDAAISDLRHVDPGERCDLLGVFDADELVGVVTAYERRLWRLAGPIESMSEVLEAAGVFVVAEDFADREVDAVTLRATEHHPHVVYVNAALPADRMRMTLAHELGHLVMDAMTLVSPVEVERRATAFAAEFLAPIDDIGPALDRVSVRTVHELDELRMTWGVSESSLVVRARDRGVFTDYQYRSMFRFLNETGRVHGHRAGVDADKPRLVADILEQLDEAGYPTAELDDITLLTGAQRAALFGTADPTRAPRHLSMV